MTEELTTSEIDPKALKPGTRVRHKSGTVVVLSHRKVDDTGWWLKDEQGGLVDWTIDGDNWTVVGQGDDPDEQVDPATEFDTTVEGVTDALEPLGFEPVILAWNGSEPCASLDLGDGRCLDVTVKLRRWCRCCDLDGTHDHDKCEHPCCPDNDATTSADPATPISDSPQGQAGS